MNTGQKIKAGILIFIIPVILVLVFPFSKSLEDKSIDMRMKFRGEGDIDRRIVVISIDEESFREMDLRWPWPRTVFADLLNRIAPDGPLAVGFDVEFSGFEINSFENVFAGSARQPDINRRLLVYTGYFVNSF